MKKFRQFPLMVLAIFVLSSLAAAQQPAGTEMPSPIIAYKNTSPIILEGREYDLVNLIIDFPKGAGFPRHFHGGNVIVTVLSGEITLQQQGGIETVVKTGEMWSEKPGEEHAVVNKGLSARVSATMLLPKGEALTTFVK